MANDRWEIDLKVLEAVSQVEEGDDRYPGWQQVASVAGMDESTVKQSLRRLENAYLTFTAMAGDGDPLLSVRDIRLLPEGRRAVHQWPDPQDALKSLVAALNQAADEATEPDEENRLRQAATSLGGLGRDVAASVVGAYLAHVSGIG